MAAAGHHPQINRATHTLDAESMPVGRLSSLAVRYLTGKHKPEYQPNIDVGDFVTIINGSKLKFSGRKFATKVYYDMSRYPGGIRERQVRELAATRPGEIYRRAVFAMLPKNKLRVRRLRRLTVQS